MIKNVKINSISQYQNLLQIEMKRTNNLVNNALKLYQQINQTSNSIRDVMVIFKDSDKYRMSSQQRLPNFQRKLRKRNQYV